MSYHFKKTLLASALSLAILDAHSGVVTDSINYQYFRDFAENKGKFVLGESNIEVIDNQGHSRGFMLADGTPVPDWSIISVNNGVAHLIDPQYIASVKHNKYYKSVAFGSPKQDGHPESNFNYFIVDRNEKPPSGQNGREINIDDYHIPRLHKLVTETAPIPVLKVDDWKVLQDRRRFPYIMRNGMGVQKVRPIAGGEDKEVAGFYQYLIGGNIMNGIALLGSGELYIGAVDGRTAVNSSAYGPMPTITLGGDSGSPIIAYDADQQQWTAIAVHRAGNKVNGNWTVLHHNDFIEKTMNEDKVHVVNKVRDSRIHWLVNENASTITSTGDKDLRQVVNVYDKAQANPTQTHFRKDLNHGKSVYFSGERATLRLGSDIHQGAGALYFDADMTVIGPSRDDATWVGAGISVADGKKVEWRLHNPAGDRLSKIGKGTLSVSGRGKNLGDVSVGDGKLILAQQADRAGERQAFNQVHITSGRPTVVLGDEHQVSPDNIVFGHRGGRLDLNGNDLTFNRLRTVDEGAKIVNHNPDRPANLTLTVQDNLDTGNNRQIFQGNLGEIKPTVDTPNHALNVRVNASSADKVMILSGDINLDGKLSVENGTVILSGSPVPHAYDHLGKKDVVLEDEWLNHNFTAKSFEVRDNGVLSTSRNVPQMTGDVSAFGDATVNLGAVNGKTDNCYRSDYTGQIYCSSAAIAEKNLVKLNLSGDVHAQDHAHINVNNATILGNLNAQNHAKITLNSDVLAKNVQLNDESQLHLKNPNPLTLAVSGARRSQVVLHENSHWQLPDSGKIGHLDGKTGSQITLNTTTNPSEFKNLTLNGDLSGSIQFNHQTNLAQGEADTLTVHGYATGNHTLTVQNTGAEAKVAELDLVALKHGGQESKDVEFKLKDDFVHAGAWRYTLKNDETNRYYLFNEQKSEEIRVRKDAEAKKAAEDAQKAKQALADAIKAREDAQKALEQALANGGASAKDLEVAQQQAQDARKLAEQAQASKANAERQLAEIRQQLADAQTAQTQADDLRVQAQQSLQEALAAKNALQDQLNAVNGAKTQAENEKLQAQAALRQAINDKAQADIDKTQAIQSLQQALTAQVEAERQKVKAQEDLQELQAQKTNLEQQLANIQGTKNTNDEELTALRHQLASFNQQLSEKEKALTEAQAAQLMAKQAQDHAEHLQNQAQKRFEQANQVLVLANQQKDEALNKAIQAEQAKNQIEQQLNQTQAQLTQANADKKDAEHKWHDAKLALKNAQDIQQDLSQAKQDAQNAQRVAEQALKLAEEEAKKQASLAKKAQEALSQSQINLAKLQSDLTQSQKELNQTQLVLSQAQSDKSALQNQLDAANAENMKAQSELAQAILAKKTAQEALQLAQKNDSADVAKLTQDLTNANAQVAQKTDELQNVVDAQTALKNNLANKERELGNLTQMLTKANQAKEKAQNQLVAKQQELASIQAKLIQSQADKQTADLARQKAEKDKQQVQENLVKSQSDFIRLKSDKTKLEEDLASAVSSKNQAEKALKVAQDGLVEAQAEKKALEGALKLAQSQGLADVTKLQSNLLQVQAQVTKQEQALTKANQAKEKAQNQLVAKQQELASIQAKLIQSQADKQTADLARQKAEKDKQQAQEQVKQVTQLFAQNTKLAQQQAEDAKKVAQLAKEQAKNALADVKSLSAKLQASTAANEQTIAQLKVHLAQAQQKLDSQNQVLVDAQQSLMAMNQQLANIELQNEQLQKQLSQEQQLREQAQMARNEAIEIQKQAEIAKADVIVALNQSQQKQAEAQQRLADVERLADEKSKLIVALEQERDRLIQKLAQTLVDLKAQKASLIQSQSQTRLVLTQAEESKKQSEAQQAEKVSLAKDSAAQKARQDAQAAQNVKQSDVISQYANTALSELSAGAYHLVHINQRINERVQHLDSKHSGVWIQADTQKTHHFSDQYRGYEQKSQLTQIGLDHALPLSMGDLILGASLSHLHYVADYADDFKGKGQLVTGTAYGKWQHHDGLALMGDVSIGQAKSETKHHQTQMPDINKNMSSVGLGVAKTFNNDLLDVKVHTGVHYHQLGSANYQIRVNDGTEVSVKQDKIGMMSYQAGVNIGKAIQMTHGLNIRPSVGVSYRHTNSDAKIHINNQALTQKFANEVVGQVGVVLGKENVEIKLQADYAKNNESGTRVNALAGVNFKF
ncbi:MULTISPECIES: S6 family peptidase [unclassified Moraxella]|uniref:S6 family peptidase n=1 Tax=unclassified Moraxella TaxID=2685852 RepID=UPI002B402632|nr:MULTISPECIES: S6 family peptidase [unclassified Moraxella]